MSASKESLAIYEAMVANKDNITRIIGDISPDQVDNLEEEIAWILTKFNSNHYTEDRMYGHLACILTQMAYQLVINGQHGYMILPKTKERTAPTR